MQFTIYDLRLMIGGHGGAALQHQRFIFLPFAFYLFAPHAVHSVNDGPVSKKIDGSR
jgi:hypothetical protein